MGVNVYQMVTDRIIAELEKGNIPWHKPWCLSSKKFTGAYNRITGKPYSLLNQMILPLTGEYASALQIKQAGGYVRKGEKASIVVFFKMYPVTETKDDGTEVKKTIPLLKYNSVFHVATQVEKIKPIQHDMPEEDNKQAFKPIESAEKLISDYKVREALVIKEVLSNEAFYVPSMDYVEVPERKQFKECSEFYSTLFHEMVHSTGHELRLNRFDAKQKVARFGSQDYSKEELIAEIGSASILNELGIETPSSFKNSVAYVQSWLKVLKNDCRFIVSASSKAGKAVNYIKGIKKTETITE